MNAFTVNDAQIRTHALTVAISRAAAIAPIEDVINEAKKVEMFLKFGTVPDTVPALKK